MRMPEVLIYQKAKQVAQSGSFGANLWYMKFINYAELDSKFVFDIMNWQGSRDTLRTINIPFNSMEDAMRFADQKRFKYFIDAAPARIVKPKSYDFNFKKTQ